MTELTKREPTRSPIHGYLVATCEARVEQAFTGAPYDAPVATAIAAALGQLERLERYKVDRFREASLLFELTTVDALNVFSRQGLILAKTAEENIARLGDPMKRSNRLELNRSIALAYAHADVATGSRAILALARQFADITDTFGMNTHYSVVYFVDALVYGLIGLDFSRPGWRPRE